MAKKNLEAVNAAEQQTEAHDAAEHETATQTAVIPSAHEIDAIIRKRVYAAIGIGFVPVPLVDLAGLTTIQLELIHALAKAYGVEFKQERAKSIISSLCGGFFSVATVPFFASLFKSIPVIGSTAGAATISIVGGSTTYALGLVFDRHFREGGTLLDFDAQNTKTYFKTKLEEGKTVISKMKSKKTDESADETVAAEADVTA